MTKYVWVRIAASCQDCKVVIDLPVHVPSGTSATASLIHATGKHYVDLRTDEGEDAAFRHSAEVLRKRSSVRAIYKPRVNVVTHVGPVIQPPTTPNPDRPR